MLQREVGWGGGMLQREVGWGGGTIVWNHSRNVTSQAAGKFKLNYEGFLKSFSIDEALRGGMFDVFLLPIQFSTYGLNIKYSLFLRSTLLQVSACLLAFANVHMDTLSAYCSQ